LSEFVEPLVQNLKLDEDEIKIFCEEHVNFGATNDTEVHFVLSCLCHVIIDKLLVYYDKVKVEKKFTVSQRKYIAVLVKEKKSFHFRLFFF
jgi:hypothetical protein